MPRSRGSDMPQRQSPRGPHQLRTSSSDRPIADRSPKLGERKSPRTTPQSDTLNQKKLGTRIADLESQLGQAQQELKILKNQLSSAEAAKKEAQQELEKKVEKFPSSSSDNDQESHKTETPVPQDDDSNSQETDVFEVPVDKEAKSVEKSAPLAMSEPEKPSMEDLKQKEDEITELKSKLEEREKEKEFLSKENENLKNQFKEAESKLLAAEINEEGLKLRISQMSDELEARKANGDKLSEKLKSVEGEKEALETEMKKMRIQTEQWRKAADAAASVLAGGVDFNPRISERCGSMDKHFGGMFETPGGYNNNNNGRFVVGSPGIGEDLEDGFGSVKKKGSGIRMFGDLWKKKGQK